MGNTSPQEKKLNEFFFTNNVVTNKAFKYESNFVNPLPIFEYEFFLNKI